MKEWRLQHPKATLREIEAALDERLGRLRARMLPFDRISPEMVFRGLYHFSQAYQKGADRRALHGS